MNHGNGPLASRPSNVTRPKATYAWVHNDGPRVFENRPLAGLTRSQVNELDGPSCINDPSPNKGVISINRFSPISSLQGKGDNDSGFDAQGHGYWSFQ